MRAEKFVSDCRKPFLLDLCRVGSVGWHPHKFMEVVHGRTHLGKSFTAVDVPESHALYKEHLRPLLETEQVDCEYFLNMMEHTPPMADVTVFVICNGKVKDGQMLPLHEQRQAEFAHLCSHIHQLIEGAHWL